MDSYDPISPDTVRNAKGWYLGGHVPQFWGRYLSGDAGVTTGELAYARKRGIYVFLIVHDRNCSQCSGGDVCHNDDTAEQARADADRARRAATRLHIPAGVVLFKDIEQVAACGGEPTADYLYAWYRTLLGSPYKTGFYGNTHEQSYDFPTGYCATVRQHPDFRDEVVLDMNEDEPQLGAPRKTIGPENAPPFAPKYPRCAPRRNVLIWQYGESITRANLTDVDQMRPGVHGLLAPTGAAT